MMKLYKHQQNLIDKSPDKRLLCWDTGTGKTKGAIEWAKSKGIVSLVICPKSIKMNWQIAVNKEFPVVTKEEFRRDWKELGDYEGLIVDECHFFSGPKSQMSKNLFKYIKKNKIEYILMLTATPYLSTPWNIYVLARHLGYRWNYIGFKQKFFYDIYIGRRIVPQVKNGIEKDIADLVRKIGDVVKIEDCADIPEQIFITEELELKKEQKKALEGIKEINPIVRWTKNHQIENGTLKSDGYTENEFYDNYKIERIKDLCAEKMKIAIVCRYNLQIDYYKKELEKMKEVYLIRGDVKDRESVVEEIEKSDECIVLIQASCSEGYELPSISLIIFASLSFSYKDYKQMTGRFLRLNKLNKNVYIHLVIAGGVDQAVYHSVVEEKQSFDVSIYERGNFSNKIQ